jgi:chromate transporter
MPAPVPSPAPIAGTLPEVVRLLLRLGATAFGGPAVHIAMMRDEVVARRRWMTDQEFLDLVGATNLIPGPNSTEMAIHIGYRRAGWAGLIAGGLAFILPATLIVLILAWVYVHYGTTPQAEGLLYGIKPVIMAIVAQALWALGRTAVKNATTAMAGVAGVALYLLGVNEIVLLAAGGLVVALATQARQGWRGVGVLVTSIGTGLPVLAQAGGAHAATAATAVAATVAFDPGRLFLIFLKIGSVLYGSGYVLLAFLRQDFVVRLGWLTDQQLLDAVAIGQFTPGPLFTTATFMGYVLGGVPAALLATVGIFLPAFVFVAASHPFIPRMRRSPWAGAVLDGVNVVSLALMAVVSWRLLRTAVTDPTTAAVAAATLVLLARLRMNSAWLVLAGALVGLVAKGW